MLSRLRWPLPAVLVWVVTWAVFRLTLQQGGGHWLAFSLACGLGVMASLLGDSWWRRLIIALGFPSSLAIAGHLALPSWAWLLPLLLLLLIYPLNAWRDAPLFPTPKNALNRLPAQFQVKVNALILDAGCGLGDGLIALRSAFPKAQLHGLEWSWPLFALCSLRCPWAQVRQGDIWRVNWSGYDLVYLFQRPESMPRAAVKARAELKPGAWLVSLEFEAVDLPLHICLQTPDGRPIWVYQIPLVVPTGS